SPASRSASGTHSRSAWNFLSPRCTIACHGSSGPADFPSGARIGRSGSPPAVRAARGTSQKRPSFPSLTILALAIGILADAVCAQELAPKDKPKQHVPLHPETKQELDHREALKLYGIAVLHERSHRLLEATRTFEKARHLEPDAAPIH